MPMEMLDMVDDDDHVIGVAERNDVVGSGRTNCRVINIFVVTGDGRIITPLRSANRRLYPNRYDFSVGGFVASGESYEEAAYRELEEELGIRDVRLDEIGYFHPNALRTSSFSKLYRLVYDGDLRYDTDGIAEIRYFARDELIDMIEKTPQRFKGDFIPLFRWAVERGLL